MGAGLFHVFVVFTLLCVVATLGCLYADGVIDEWLDRAEDTWRVFKLRHRL
jgi:hypothetical protein